MRGAAEAAPFVFSPSRREWRAIPSLRMVGAVEALPFPGEPASERERAIAAAQIGRDPRGDVAVAARCEHGLPAVLRTSPRLADGTPFPTLYWLTCPLAIRAVGRLEAGGLMGELNGRIATDPAFAQEYRLAHERYLEQRDALEPLDDPASAGGMPRRVKCLHALYAHEVAESNPAGAAVAARIEPLGCPGPCVREEGEAGRFAPVAGHPAFRRRA